MASATASLTAVAADLVLKPAATAATSAYGLNGGTGAAAADGGGRRGGGGAGYSGGGGGGYNRYGGGGGGSIIDSSAIAILTEVSGRLSPDDRTNGEIIIIAVPPPLINADGSIYNYSTNADGSANIVSYAGPPWVVTIPTNINGLTVTTIGVGAFDMTSLTSVTIPTASPASGTVRSMTAPAWPISR